MLVKASWNLPLRERMLLLCSMGWTTHPFLIEVLCFAKDNILCRLAGYTFGSSSRTVKFTGAPTPSVALLVQCLWPLDSCSPVCLLGVLCCVCGVLGNLAPVHRCARSVLGFACAVSWVTWLLFTGVPARCVVERVRCPGPLGSCSPVCSLGVLCCGLRVRGADSSIRTAAVRSRQGLGTLRARTRPSRRRLVFLGTRSRAVARCVLCALSGFAAPGGRCCLAPVRVPWLWPAPCVSGVPRGPVWCVAPRPLRWLSVLW